MTEQERRVVNHAMKILEQSQDDEARALAVKLMEQGTKVPLQKVQFYAAYCNGLLKNIRPNTRWWMACKSEQEGNAILRSREETCRELY